jgi:CheY-like chemotaxis protein/HPt (histidine-containing phosphotransfer) domain-containing protein
VRARPLDDPGRHEFHFTVRDTGMGIPPDRLDRLFREFSQADASIGAQFGGTGLGLAICRKLAELHGGRVWVESEVGVGSAFHLAIPALARADVATSSGPARDSLRGLRALIVDDNATNIDILRAQTESWGMRVRATQSPAEALGWVEGGHPFDLIITDQEMPMIDGIELATRIRRLPRGATVPIVLLTSLSSGGQLKQLPGSSLAAVLTKPIRQSELFNRISEVLAPAVPAATPPAAEKALAVSPLSILLAEDNLMNQKVALVLLERIGYAADLVSDGQQAIEAVGRKAYDVVLMDVQMPKVGGMEATRAIRAHGSAIRQPRIIAMTANAMRGDREACLAAGMDDYVSKPIDRNELVLALQRAALAGPATHAPGPASGAGSPEIDAEAFASQLRDVGQAEMAGLIDLFADTAPQTAAQLRKAAEAKDPRALASAAHQLKSMATTLGARSLGKLLDELEAAGRTRASGDFSAQVVLVEGRLRALLSELAAARPK